MKAIRVPSIIVAAMMIVIVCRELVFDAKAQVKISQLSTRHGILLSRPCNEKENVKHWTECEVITLNGKKLFSDVYASISAAYPSQTNPLLVSIGTSGGGNAGIDQTSYIIDLTTSSPIIVKDFGFGKDIFQSENGVVFNQYVGIDELGDTILGLFKYVLGSGRPELLRKFPEYSMTPLSQKELPYEILSDPILRTPLLRAVGSSNFRDFRASVATSSYDQLKIIDNRFIVGSGCWPHRCSEQKGMFVIDQLKNVAWALESDESGQNSTITLWGDLRIDDTIPVRKIGEWLQEHRLSWNMIRVAPLPPAVYQAYASSKILEQTPKTNLYADTSGKTNINIRSADRKTTELSPVALFKMLSPSIFIVHAKKSNGDEFQGSAVAIYTNTLLTNCHVVNQATEITLSQKGKQFEVSLMSANVNADRCVLQTSSQIKSYVSIRPYDQLEIGEKLFSIGAPLGLELTLSDGLLSGKRTLSGERLVQTTAPISPGSSGEVCSMPMGTLSE